MVKSVNFVIFTTRKIFIFLFISVSILLFLYIIGNRQEFLDSTQIFIFKLILYSSSLDFIIGIILISAYITAGVKVKRINAAKLIFSLLATFFCLGILITVKFISVWLA